MSSIGISIGIDSSAALAPFHPLQVTSVPIFAYYEVSAAGDAASLTDRGPNGYHAVQAVSGKRATFSAADALFSGLPSLTSDAVDDELVAASMPLTAPGTVPKWYWFIFAQVAWTTGCIFGGGAGNTHIVYGNGSSPNLRAFNGSNGGLNAGAPVGVAKRGVLKLTNSAADHLLLGESLTSPVVLGNNSTTGFALFSGNGGAYSRIAMQRLLITIGEPSLAERAALDAGAVALFGASVLT